MAASFGLSVSASICSLSLHRTTVISCDLKCPAAAKGPVNAHRCLRALFARGFRRINLGSEAVRNGSIYRPCRIIRRTRASAQQEPLETDGARQEGKPLEGAVAESLESSPKQEEGKAAANPDEIGAEFARIRQEKAVAGGNSGNFLQGVLEETKLIEWPAFSSVLGTTGVVLAIIVISTFVLLTVNAVLAELSDKIFAA